LRKRFRASRKNIPHFGIASVKIPDTHNRILGPTPLSPISAILQAYPFCESSTPKKKKKKKKAISIENLPFFKPML
jgi:hypothetical protein